MAQSGRPNFQCIVNCINHSSIRIVERCHISTSDQVLAGHIAEIPEIGRSSCVGNVNICDYRTIGECAVEGARYWCTVHRCEQVNPFSRGIVRSIAVYHIVHQVVVSIIAFYGICSALATCNNKVGNSGEQELMRCIVINHNGIGSYCG